MESLTVIKTKTLVLASVTWPGVDMHYTSMAALFPATGKTEEKVTWALVFFTCASRSIKPVSLHVAGEFCNDLLA